MALDTLHQIFTKNADLLGKIYRDPRITAYNRLEPRARTEDFARSLRAEIRDPLWMLTRQWQMGELEAEDAGSAIDARLLTSQAQIDRVSLGGASAQPYDENIPLETVVERETIALDDDRHAAFPHALKLQIAHFFLKLHSDALRLKYAEKYRSAFPIAPNQEESFRGQPDALNVYVATRRRDFDGQQLLRALADGTFNTKAGIANADRANISEYTSPLTQWFSRQYSQPGSNAWDPKRLTYAMQAAAPRPDGSQLVLDASHYNEGRLDWYSFELEPIASIALNNNNNEPAPAPEAQQPISFIPTAATFRGMPNPRFWEMENRQVNFGQLDAKTTDTLLLTFAELGLIYGNDWFVIPYTIKANTLCEVVALVVTDVFGERTLIRAADEGEENNWQRWSMFNLSNLNELGSYNRQFFLPATITTTLESDPLEQVNYTRDEMTNMVWAVEEVIPDGNGKGISGYDAADRFGVEPPPIAASTANIRYVLGTTVPENWIPFLPVHEAGSNQSIQFRRAAMPKLGVPPTEVVRPKGLLLTEVPKRYYINEEEIPAAGTLVRRSYQRTRWYNGRTYVWIGRYRETGRGQASSDLRFDQIEPIAPS
jgi:hypothetical protein